MRISSGDPACPHLESLFSRSKAGFRAWTEDERQASLDSFMQTWAAGDDIWVFGYGSLVWRPEFEFQEQRLARIGGYHRSLCLWSRINRGTPERPGLVFGLDIGGSCRGMAYRIAASRVPDTLRELWKREMASGAYIPRWLGCQTGHGKVRALVFTIDRGKSAYVRGLDTGQLLAIVRDAHGIYGPCVEYVLETDQALKRAGIHDRKLEALVARLSAPETI